MDVNLIYNTEANLAILDIIENIRNNDIENLKKNIEILNNDTSITEPLNNMLDLTILVDRFPNESIKYLLENLIPIRNQEQLLWNYEVKLLSQDYDPIEIENFIKNEIEKTPWKMPQYKINAMTRLAIVSNNFDALKLVKAKINVDKGSET